MTPEETAAACAPAVSGIAANFMLDPGTYATGAQAGFSGLDFYARGRGGALGDVEADVVIEAFHFFEPGNVRENWEKGASVMPGRDAAARFIECGHRWAAEHLGDGVDWARLAELIGRVNAAGDEATGPLFAAWRSMPEPSGDDPRALALHRLNGAREHRFAAHTAAVRDAGITPVEAMAARSPHMMAIFGWTDTPEVSDELRARWDAAEADTNARLAPAYAALDESERDELASLCTAALAAVK
jgi:hypothetical protein